jgi:UDP-N-acetylmuramoyl-L-alanyl-D-glutamate--2,6-diaminopimelate ligase
MIIEGIKVKGITCNSKRVKKGYVFVAIEGQYKDGNEYIDEAIDKGAVLVFTEKDISKKEVPIIKVPNARKKLAELLNAFYDYPSEKLKLVGVTGTNGKTTTTYLIEKILNNAGYKTGLIGTLGVRIGDEYIPPTLTTPEPEILFDLLHRMVKAKVDVVVMEVSSHGLKFNRTHCLEFDIAVHTNIEKDHMNLHHTIEDYVNTKKKLFDSLNRNKIAIINVDDKHGIKLIEGNNRVLVLTYGLSNKATITASSLDISNDLNFNVCLQRGLTTIDGKEIEPIEFKINVNLMGRHNVYNALAATAVALTFGVDISIIRETLSKVKGVRRRLEKIYESNFLVIDDFSHNPASYEAVFETIQSLEYNNLILVNAIRGNRGVQVNKENAEVIASWTPVLGINKLILSLSNDTVNDKDKVSKDELTIYKDIFYKNSIKFEVFDTLKQSIRKALETVEKNDIILLLGAQGMDKGRETLYNLIVNDKK